MVLSIMKELITSILSLRKGSNYISYLDVKSLLIMSILLKFILDSLNPLKF